MPKILFPLFVLILLIPITSAEDQFSLRFRYKIPGDIFVLTAGDIDSNGMNEAIVSSGNNLYVIDGDGKLKHNYKINSSGKISAISIADLYNDGRNEIIVGTGRMETKEVNEEPFYVNGLTMIEKTKRLIKTTKNEGEIYLIDGGNISKFHDVDGWVRSIDVSNGEIIVGAGGSNIDYFEEIFYVGGNKTRNYTNYMSWAGSILIFNKTELINEYRSNDAFSSISAHDIYGDQENEIIAGSGNELYAFGNNFSLLWNYTAMGDIKDVYVGYTGDREEKNIVLSFSGKSIDGVHTITSNGKELWTYRMPFQSRLSGFSVGNLGRDYNEVVLASGNAVHILDSSGKERLEYWIGERIDKIYLTDLDANGYTDLLVSSKGTLSVYEVTKGLIKKQLADGYYNNARKLYEAKDYGKADEYIKNASKLYTELNDTEGSSRSDSLYYKILEGVKSNRRIEANSLYANALSYYGFNDYTSAISYAKKSIEIYIEINDTEGISQVNALITAITGKIENNITGETTPATSTTINARTDETPDKIPQISNPLTLVVIIVIVLSFILVIIKIRKSKS